MNNFQIHRGRNFRTEDGQKAPDAIHHLNRVGAGLALDGEHDGAVVVHPGPDLVVFHVVQNFAQFLQTHRIAVAVSDDHAPVLGRIRQLTGGFDGEGLLGAVQFSGGKVAVVGLDGGLYFVDADAARGQAVRIQLDADRVFLAAEHLHLRYAADGGDALRHHSFGVLIHGVDGQRGRTEAQEESPADRTDSPC